MKTKVFNCTVKLPDPEGLLRKANLEKGGLVQQVIDKAVIRFCTPYVPWKTGVLAGSAKTATIIGSGEIVYPGPYARYLYYGKVYGPSFPIFEDDSGVPTKWRSRKGIKKHPTGKDLTYRTDKNPLAGPFWVERMKADHLDDIVEEAKHAAGIK